MIEPDNPTLLAGRPNAYIQTHRVPNSMASAIRTSMPWEDMHLCPYAACIHSRLEAAHMPAAHVFRIDKCPHAMRPRARAQEAEKNPPRRSPRLSELQKRDAAAAAAAAQEDREHSI